MSVIGLQPLGMDGVGRLESMYLPLDFLGSMTLSSMSSSKYHQDQSKAPPMDD